MKDCAVKLNWVSTLSGKDHPVIERLAISGKDALYT